jgi:hypothetical protein
MIREYILTQAVEEKRFDQMGLGHRRLKAAHMVPL